MKILSDMETEPARRITRIVGAAIGLFNAAVFAVRSFGVDLTAEQVEAILGVGNGVGGLLVVIAGGIAIRERVTPWTPDDQALAEDPYGRDDPFAA